MNLTSENKIYRESKDLSAIGWYRIATSNIQTQGCVLEIELISSYNYQKPISKKIVITVGWSGCDIQAIATKDEDSLVSKIRTVQQGSNTARNLYVDIYYNKSQQNLIKAFLMCKNRGLVLDNFTLITETPSGSVTEKNI